MDASYEYNLNTSTNSIPDYFNNSQSNSEGNKFAQQTLLILLGFLGIIFNIFVIILAVKYTVLKNLHHLIINIAVADTIFLFTNSVITLPTVFNAKWIFIDKDVFSSVLCKVSILLYDASYLASPSTLLVISIERFRATRRTLQRSRPYTRKQRLAVLGVAWFIPMAGGICAAIPAVASQGICTIPDNEYTENKFIGYFWLIYNITTVLACSIIFILSIFTIRRLSQPQEIQAHINDEQQRARTLRTRVAVRMVLVSTLLYVLCMLPIYGMYLFRSMKEFVQKSPQSSACEDTCYYIFFFLLPSCNACISPCIYIIFLSDFQQAFKRVICRSIETEDVRTNRLEMQ